MRGAAGLALLAALAGVVGGCRDRRGLEELERALGTVQDAPPAPPDDPLLARYLQVERIFAAGLAPMDLAERVRISPDVAVQRTVRLDPALCYVIAAVAIPDHVRLRVSVYDREGQAVAADRSPDAFPVVPSFCPSDAELVTIRMTVRGGEADLLWNLWPIRDEASAHRSLESLRRAWSIEGTPLGPVQRGLLAEGGTLDVPVALLPGSCYGVVARAESETADLDLAWLDARRRPVQRDIALDGQPVLPAFCPEIAEMHTLRLTMARGQGAFHWQIFQRPGA
jgi:hypothetical protein